MTTVALSTLGCKTNQFESAAMHEALAKAGYTLVPFADAADIYVVNTCTVTAKADAESRRIVRRAARTNPQATIVVTGCYAQVAVDAVKDLPGVRLVLGNDEKKDLVSLLQGIGPVQQVRVGDIMSRERVAHLPLETFAEHTRAFLQIQNGCEAYCSYCIVPFARGRSRSVLPDDILAGVDRFLAGGFREIVLTGIHLGAYGLDLHPPTSLRELVATIIASHDVPRLRIGSVEPQEIDPQLIDLLATHPAICPHLHIPLQAGSDGVLARMNRRYTTAEFAELLARITSRLPQVTIGLDLIAGFPGETDAEFQEGFDFISRLPVAYCHVFPYSPRPGTAAADMPHQVPPAVVRDRAAQLRQLGEEKGRQWREQHLHQTLQVLGQELLAGGLVRGLARNYLTVIYPGGNELLNREVAIQIKGFEGENLRGVVVSG